MWRMNDSLKRLTGDWAIFTEVQRRRVTQRVFKNFVIREGLG